MPLPRRMAAAARVRPARPGGCIAVISTVLPATIATLAAQAAGRSVALVDTPVAGRGMFSIGEGNMSVLVGDDGELAARLEPTLLRFASRRWGARPPASPPAPRR
ncbi:MAG: hypothetical protein IPM40_01680 [Gammaproteobacteria bacterium]|nr:hypothetical protein [Gammaproteobacteria bacterium]